MEKKKDKLVKKDFFNCLEKLLRFLELELF